MRYLTWIIALGLLTLFFNRWLNNAENPNSFLATQADPTSPVVLQQNRQGHYVASGLVNDQPVKFLLDTGATNLSIPASVAKRLNLERGNRSRVHTANGSIEVFNTQLNYVQLGHIRIANVSAHINPYMQGDTVLLGMSFLKHLNLQQQDKTLSIRIP